MKKYYVEIRKELNDGLGSFVKQGAVEVYAEGLVMAERLVYKMFNGTLPIESFVAEEI